MNLGSITHTVREKTRVIEFLDSSVGDTPLQSLLEAAYSLFKVLLLVLLNYKET